VYANRYKIKFGGVMNHLCESCGSEVIVQSCDGGTSSYELVNKRLDGIKRDIPFRCSLCGSIQLLFHGRKFVPTRDIVFLWPLQVPDKIGSFWVPESYKESRQTSLGTVLAVGPGYYDKKKSSFFPMELEVGMYVIYNKDVPWSKLMDDPSGKEREVKYMGMLDVLAEVDEG
jgi:co-chaperonin GroES (HSP10)